MVPDKLLKLMGSTVDEFTEAHSVASIQELKQFWTEVLRDKSANMAARISAASELAKAKGVFAAANKKKPVEKEPMSDVETKAKIAQLLLERETE